MRYAVLDLPVSGNGAFAPRPAVDPVASSYGLVKVSGAPGTEAVSAPAPQRTFLPNLTRRRAPDTAQGSDVAPDLIAPSIYLAHTDNMGPAGFFGMAARRRNPLPVPALAYPLMPRVVQPAPRIGGRRAMVTPRAFQRYR